MPLAKNSLCPGVKAPKMTPHSVISYLQLGLFETGCHDLWKRCSWTGKARDSQPQLEQQLLQGRLELLSLPKPGGAGAPLLQKPLRGSGRLPVLPHLVFPFAALVSCCWEGRQSRESAGDSEGDSG